MLRLHTLGTTYVSGEDGSPLPGAATHRRTLALLGLLAASGTGGLNRDKVIGWLWPDTDEARARHSLTQALYSVRRALDCDDLFVISGPTIRINPDRLTSDIQDFEDCLARGDFASAVELYAGPFLDAVFLTDAGDFERWASAERERLMHRLSDALESLSSDAESTGDVEHAVRWRRRQAALLPLDGRIATRLMRALADAGDRAGALRHAQVHASLLQQELELPPDATVVSLTEQLRLESQAATIAVRNADVPPDGERSPEAEVAAVPVAASTKTVFRPRTHQLLTWAIPLLVLAGVAGIARYGGRTPPSVSTSALAQRVVVAPFRVTGADASLAYLRDGMVELLSARLADDSSARSVDAGAVLREWRGAGLGTTADVGRDTALTLAASLGAERVVMGSVVGTSSRMVLSATMLDVATRSVAAQVSVTGSADSLVPLIDRLAGRLLVSVAGQEDVLAHYTSRSLPALKEFLAGQAAFRREDYPDALRFYERAIQRDSSFALAALNAAATADALNLTGVFQETLGVAWNSREDLNQRDLALLRAMAGPRYPMLSTSAQYAAAWQHMVDVAPQSSDAWHALAVRLLEDGPAAGLSGARARAVAALRRALALAEQHARARALMVSLEGARESPQRDTLDDASLWRKALVAGDGAARYRLRARFETMASASLRTIVLAGHHDEHGRDDARAAMARLRSRAGTPAERLTHALLDHGLAVNDGRTADALAATERVRQALTGSDAWLRLRVLDALYADGDSASAEAALETLTERDPWAPLSRPVTSGGALANACVVAQWGLSRGDTTNVRRTIDALQAAAGAAAVTSPVSASPAACVELLDAWTSVVLRPASARGHLLRVDSLVFTPQTAGDAAQYANIVLARLFARIGDTSSALAAVRRRPYMTGAPRYLSSAMRLEIALVAGGKASTSGVGGRR